MNEIRIQKKKERDQARILRFITGYLLMVGALLTIFIFTRSPLFTFKHVLILSIVCIPLAFFYVYVVERLGGGFGGILSGWSSRRVSVHETFSADLEKARYHKREKRFEEALAIINEVIEKAPFLPDAVYLKAQILWEGFERASEAKKCLKEVLRKVPQNETIHTWASNYYDRLVEHEKKIRGSDL